MLLPNAAIKTHTCPQCCFVRLIVSLFRVVNTGKNKSYPVGRSDRASNKRQSGGGAIVEPMPLQVAPIQASEFNSMCCTSHGKKHPAPEHSKHPGLGMCIWSLKPTIPRILWECICSTQDSFPERPIGLCRALGNFFSQKCKGRD